MSESVAHEAIGTAGAVPAPRAAPSPDLVRRTLVLRQAIYDASRSIAAFELLFRCSAHDDSAEQGTSQLIASTFGAFDIESISAGRAVFVNFTRAFITGVIPIPLDPGEVVVEIDESMVPDHELVLGVRALIDAGYRVALRNYRGDVGQGVLLDLADFVALDVTRTPVGMLTGLIEQVRQVGATLIAGGITDEATLQRCQAMGFELFQGPFLQQPRVIEGKTLSPIQLVCVRLLNLLSDEDSPRSRIEQLVGNDPGLSMRLLRTANSASSGVRSEVTSLRQAIVLLGPRRLRAWVVLTLLEGGATRNRSDELWSILARAIACQKLSHAEPDLAYTVGLLSGCADLLGVDAESVASGSGVGGAARAALVERTGMAGVALTAVLAHENDDVTGVTATGLVPLDVSRACLEALSEALTVVHGLTEE